MAKAEEIKLVKEEKFTRTVIKPIYTGAKEKRTKVGEFTTTMLKPEAEQVVAEALRKAGISLPEGIVGAYNYGKDLVDRSAAAPARPGVVNYFIKLHGVEVDMRTMKPEAFAKLYSTTQALVELGKIKAIPAGMAEVHATRNAKK